MELALFASTFVLVFALGMQSLNVNNGHYILAALTSFVIGSGQMVLYKIAPHASWSEIAAYLCGGPTGIVCAMRAHPALVRWLKPRPKSQSNFGKVVAPAPWLEPPAGYRPAPREVVDCKRPDGGFGCIFRLACTQCDLAVFAPATQPPAKP